jgi:antitoxin YefM
MRCEPATSWPHCRRLMGMTRIMVMPETLPLAEIKARLSEIVDKVAEQHERVTLTRNGRPAAVLISPEDLEALEETLDLLSDPKAVREIQRAREAIAKGKGIGADKLRARYLSER